MALKAKCKVCKAPKLLNPKTQLVRRHAVGGRGSASCAGSHKPHTGTTQTIKIKKRATPVKATNRAKRAKARSVLKKAKKRASKRN